MSRKTLLFLVIIIAIAILGLGVYLLFFTKPPIGNTTNTGVYYNPFGNYSGSATTTSTANQTVPTTEENGNPTTYVNSATSPLTKIATLPIAGAESFERKTAGTATTTTIVRYTDRATGHTMDYNTTTRILATASNTTIPTIYRAWWSGGNLLAQFLDKDKQTIKTYAGILPTTSTSTVALSGSFLANDIYNLAISPKGNRVFYLQAGDNAVGAIANIDGSKRNQIFTFPFNEWATQWPNENTITLTTKPSSNIAGFMYLLSSTGVMTKALGGINGLTTRTSPSLNYSLYSESTGGGISTAIYDLKKGLTTPLNHSTLPEKCLWSTLNKTVAYCAVPTNIAIGNYPDDWYQGNVSFVDNIYKIDVSLPAMQLLYSLPQDQSIDAINLFLDQKENNLYFTNKNDYSLWGLNLIGLIPKM